MLRMRLNRRTLRALAFQLGCLLCTAGPVCLPAQEAGRTFAVRPDTFSQSVDFTPYLYWDADSSYRLTFADTARLHFHPYDPLRDSLTVRIAYWFCGRVQNTSDVDSLFAFVHTTEWFEWIDAWIVRPDTVEQWRNGDFCNLGERAYRADWEAIPMNLGPGEPATFYLRLRNYFSAPRHSPIITLKPVGVMEAEIRLEPPEIHPTFVFGTVFLAILAFLTVVAGLLYRITGDRAFGWYGLYALIGLLFYLRSFEKNFHFTLLFAYVQRHYIGIEVVLGYGCFYTYLMFMRAFLDASTVSPRFDRVFGGVARFILAASGLNLFVWATWGEEMCFALYNWVRVVFFSLTFLLLYPALFRLSGPLPRYVAAGTFCIVFPAIFTLAGDMVNAVVLPLWGSAMRWMIFPGVGGFPMINTRVGLLLEMFCFAAGLALKYRMERDGRLAALRESGETRGQLDRLRQTLKDHLRQVANASAVEPPLAREARDWIEKNIDDPQLSVEKLAGQMGRSRAAFYRDLSKAAGKTPHQFILDIRLEHACRRLLSTPRSVAEIAYETGFNDPSYFSKIFAKQFGAPPSIFRSRDD